MSQLCSYFGRKQSKLLEPWHFEIAEHDLLFQSNGVDSSQKT